MTQNKIVSKVIERFKSNGKLPPDAIRRLRKIELEMKSYIERNSIEEYGKKLLCPRCLKAHLSTLACEKEAEKEFVMEIIKIIPDEIGHNGYYLDNKKVKEVKILSLNDL